MLRVSRLADYATVVMAYMALKFNELYKARDVALATHIALPTVSKILKLMVHAKLLVSTQGVKGGYSLSRQPQKISIAEVLQAIDGDFGMTVCSQANNNDCPLELHCSIGRNWQLISRTIYQALQALTLADMAHPMQVNQIPVGKEIFLDALDKRTEQNRAT